jgi:hypothetical protein
LQLSGIEDSFPEIVEKSDAKNRNPTQISQSLRPKFKKKYFAPSLQGQKPAKPG